jgi:hypothetical protein
MGHGSRFGSSFPRPLVFAGGVERRAGDKAAIGVHRVAAIRPANGAARRDGHGATHLSGRQQAWVHAMETLHDKLFIFKPDELKLLNLVTTGATPVASPAPTAPALPSPALLSPALPSPAPKARS